MLEVPLYTKQAIELAKHLAFKVYIASNTQRRWNRYQRLIFILDNYKLLDYSKEKTKNDEV